MNIKNHFIFLFFIVSFTSNILNAQKINIGFLGGYSKIYTNDFYTKDIPDIGLGLEKGYNFGVKLKYTIKNFPLKLINKISYLSMGDTGYYWDTLNPWNSHFTKMKLKTAVYIFSLDTGIEYFPFKNIIPQYFSFDLMINYFSKTEIKQNPSSEFEGKNLNPLLSERTRVGLSFGTGIIIHLINGIDADININYYLMNLIGKKSNFFNGYEFKEDDFNILILNLAIYVYKF